MSPASHYLSCEGRELHYTEWGAQHGDVVVAWHGLARTCRDMDDIAAHLSQRYRVICPDTIGRGLSQWSPAPEREYCLAFYVKLATALVDQLGLTQFHWIGTSMGGAIGTVAAATNLRGRVRKLVLNDNGPETAKAAIERIRGYAGNPAAFDTVSELEHYFRTVYKPYGRLSDAQWRRLTETSTRRLPDGRVTPHYDPAMVMQFTHHTDDYLRWDEWDSLDIPVLCLRGESSDLLLPDTAEQMRNRGPRAVVAEIAGCGHAPALNTPQQFALVERFLGAP
ncbi:MAG: alpha/beta hydrolase [Bacteriovorax sp.]|nr:alpha/beta hydrolase [Rhizobacter sp.]